MEADCYTYASIEGPREQSCDNQSFVLYKHGQQHEKLGNVGKLEKTINPRFRRVIDMVPVKNDEVAVCTHKRPCKSVLAS